MQLSRPTLLLSCVCQNNRVAAPLARFVNGEFGSINQVGDDVFALEFLASDGFDDASAQRNLR